MMQARTGAGAKRTDRFATAVNDELPLHEVVLSPLLDPAGSLSDPFFDKASLRGTGVWKVRPTSDVVRKLT